MKKLPVFLRKEIIKLIFCSMKILTWLIMLIGITIAINAGMIKKSLIKIN